MDLIVVDLIMDMAEEILVLVAMAEVVLAPLVLSVGYASNITTLLLSAEIGSIKILFQTISLRIIFQVSIKDQEQLCGDI